jgi:hypothetical protein
VNPYLLVYDAVTGADSVFEVDPLNPTAFTAGGYTSRGWGSAVGPRRASGTTAQPKPMAPDSGYCGTALTSQTATVGPRAVQVDPRSTSG